MANQDTTQSVTIKNDLGNKDQIIGKQKEIMVNYPDGESITIEPNETQTFQISDEVNVHVTPGAPRKEKSKITIKVDNIQYEFHMWIDRAWDLKIKNISSVTSPPESANVTIGQEEDG